MRERETEEKWVKNQQKKDVFVFYEENDEGSKNSWASWYGIGNSNYYSTIEVRDALMRIFFYLSFTAYICTILNPSRLSNEEIFAVF